MPNMKLFLHINNLLTTLHEEKSSFDYIGLDGDRLVLWSPCAIVDDRLLVSLGEPVAEHHAAHGSVLYPDHQLPDFPDTFQLMETLRAMDLPEPLNGLPDLLQKARSFLRHLTQRRG